MKPDATDDPNFRPVRILFVLFGLSLLYVSVCAAFSFGYGPIWAFIAVLMVLPLGICLSEVIGRHPSARWHFLLAVISVVLATFIGTWNYQEHWGLFLLAASGRTYKDVSATSPAVAHLDAGQVWFDEDAVLDDSSAIGYKEFRYTYCVAPVIGASNQDKVQYWAVGLDCCDERGGFRCDDATDIGVKGGLVVPRVGAGAKGWDEDGVSSLVYVPPFVIFAIFLTFCLSSYATFLQAAIVGVSTAFILCILVPEVIGFRVAVASSSHDGYIRAIQASAAMSNKVAAEHPLLIRWVAEPAWILAGWNSAAIAIWVSTSIAHLFIAFIACVLLHVFYQRKITDALQRSGAFSQQQQYNSMGSQAGAPGQSRAGGNVAFRDPFLLRGTNPMQP
eukprot:gnl/MRDRNA2_/MRDRNA2_122996_c0_seq1.p1 gnl/MRDRNA2_/MRDRNA2_122996_c0~~gnl/MRDRNA2_/MRDRNA2_122996_c0_seq1.p1  ORF type:complete len:405 (+),score=57.52 gnl/MRDRNA2_/MRDRNA2_122996_c0_seq1:48-1217(+)